MSAKDEPYHAHIYYGSAERDTAAALREQFRNMPEVLFVGSLSDNPAGPHPMAQFEIHFLGAAVPAVVAMLKPSGLRALVHPLTNDDLADHTRHAQWIGEPLALDETMLDPPGVNQGIARFGKSDL